MDWAEKKRCASVSWKVVVRLCLLSRFMFALPLGLQGCSIHLAALELGIDIDELPGILNNDFTRNVAMSILI